MGADTGCAPLSRSRLDALTETFEALEMIPLNRTAAAAEEFDNDGIQALDGGHSRQNRQETATSVIRNKALRIGFDAVGFCRASLGSEAREHLNRFIQAGYHGDMGWLATRAEQRVHPQSLWPEARSIIVVGLSYAPEDDPLAITAHRSKGAISVYARNRDYHDLIKGKLKHLGQFLVSRYACDVKIFVDTAPVMEKPLAQRGGLGWQGKHTNLVSRSHGAWLLLGEIYTTMELQPDKSTIDHCGSCSRCLDICPTKAFPAPYRLDATRCISYLTIEHRGPIPWDLRKAIGNRIYGCDDCLAVCPWNKFAQPTSHEQLIGRDALRAPLLMQLVALDDRKFRELFSGSPIKRIGRNRFIRNVLIAIGNSEDSSLRHAAEALRLDPDPVVAEAANWAVQQLDHTSS
jgi:epoxyqueuosine reductase